jgi:hypothetical protein
MKKLFFTLSFAVLSIVAYSQDSPQDIVDKFFKEFETKGSSYALDNLYKPNKWISRNADAIMQLKSQISELNEDYVGKYYGSEFILEKKLTDSYILMSYLVKYERQPIRFTFHFYKPNKEWIIYSFKYDGAISEEIEETAKLYNFRLN